MKLFTNTEPTALKFINPDNGALVVMQPGDSMQLNDELCHVFVCDNGWGTAEGLDACERKPGSKNGEIETVNPVPSSND